MKSTVALTGKNSQKSAPQSFYIVNLMGKMTFEKSLSADEEHCSLDWYKFSKVSSTVILYSEFDRQNDF